MTDERGIPCATRRPWPEKIFGLLQDWCQYRRSPAFRRDLVDLSILTLSVLLAGAGGTLFVLAMLCL